MVGHREDEVRLAFRRRLADHRGLLAFKGAGIGAASRMNCHRRPFELEIHLNENAGAALHAAMPGIQEGCAAARSETVILIRCMCVSLRPRDAVLVDSAVAVARQISSAPAETPGMNVNKLPSGT
jgi:hypothetical protein